jgi:hypothetical protein
MAPPSCRRRSTLPLPQTVALWPERRRGVLRARGRGGDAPVGDPSPSRLAAVGGPRHGNTINATTKNNGVLRLCGPEGSQWGAPPCPP